jgi:hypothetical protein
MKQTDTIANFDPEKFLVVAEKRFDDLKIGDIFRAPSRSLTDAHAVAFQSVSATRALGTAQVSVEGVSEVGSSGSE